MAEKNKKSEKTPEEIAQDKSNLAVMIYTDPVIRGCDIANAAIDESTYGKIGKVATHNYLLDLMSGYPSQFMGQVVGTHFVGREAGYEDMKGFDTRKLYTSTMSFLELVEAGSKFRKAGRGNILFKDYLPIYHLENKGGFTDEEMNSTIAGLKENKNAGTVVSETYAADILGGVSQAINNLAGKRIAGLESILVKEEKTDDKKTN